MEWESRQPFPHTSSLNDVPLNFDSHALKLKFLAYKFWPWTFKRERQKIKFGT